MSDSRQSVGLGELSRKVGSVLERYSRDASQLVAILQDIQVEYNWLPKEALEEVSQELGIPLSRVFSVATFFRAFSLRPRGRHLIHVCLGTACHVRGAPRILEQIERQLGIRPGEMTEDLQFSLETVNCVGACALGPVVIVDGDYHGQMTPDRVKEILKKYSKERLGDEAEVG
ncbi:MAG: NADH-quinone oxidoreductase subunit NuoE [Chloroflexi bacterium]|nr:MAG: NADH-quinone oxidoreductase subunit NuoE [Chloroflexota bacterium]